MKIICTYTAISTQQDFYNTCTHILIKSPKFRNRIRYSSINVQAVCDAHLRFMNVFACWPGSTHDATIFNNSTLRAKCERGIYGNRWLIGDSAYPYKPYLLTPLLNPIAQSRQNYNEAHKRTRYTIERCFGIWKRFPILSLKIWLTLSTIYTVTQYNSNSCTS